MLDLPLEAVLVLLADCEGIAGAERVRWILIPPALVLAWGFFVWACIWRESEPAQQASLLGLLGVSAATGGLIFLVPEGVSGGGDYLLRFWISVLAALCIGVAWPLVSRPAGSWRSIGVAVAGDLVVPGGLIMLLFWSLALSGECLG